jgi:uncharacterized protein
MKLKAPLLMFAAIASFAMLSPQPASAETAGRIRVLGRATIEVVPDQVITRVGVTNQAATPKAALDQNSTAARKIIAFAKAFGVADKDIQTDSVRLSPVYKTVRDKNGNSHQVPDGYRASNQVRVRLKELPRLGEFMRQALDQGATNIAGLQFELADPSKAVDQALAEAVGDARHKAEQLAQAAMVKLGPILEIAHPPRTQTRERYAVRAAPKAVASNAVPIEAGTIAITAAVDMIWSIE